MNSINKDYDFAESDEGKFKFIYFSSHIGEHQTNHNDH
jgi:hypothetical protein